ncbi:MAG: hypothetical protein RBU37_20895 [Myxococcota bacterium]|jgi:hypothetical protein|nr:hypothetical protein [Myxococcota bacterium]
MRTHLYDAASLTLIAASIFFFYRSVTFLTEHNYIAAIMSSVIGFLILRGSVDLSRLSLLVSDDRQRSKR